MRNPIYSLLLILCCFLICPFLSYSQNVSITDDGSVPDSSAMLEIKVTNSAKKGLLIPRMTSAERIAIVSPAKGLMVFDNSTSSFWFHNGLIWHEIAPVTTNLWSANGLDISNNNSGNVGIGLNLPKASLHVAGSKTVIFGDDSVGVGPKLLWYPSKAAMRFGAIDPSYDHAAWDYSNVGINSFAFGANSKATGAQSIASGIASIASGAYSLAHGYTASAIGDYSYAFGQNAIAKGNNSFVFGNAGVAAGNSSTSFGTNAATGDLSTAFGNGTASRAYNSFVIGRFNDSISSSSNSIWNDEDPLFIVGNGASNVQRSNSLVVIKGGAVGVNKNPDWSDPYEGNLAVKGKNLKNIFSMESENNTNKWSYWMSDGPSGFGDSTNDLQMFYNENELGWFSAVNGTYSSISDMRLKKDITPISSVLKGVLVLKPYTYHYKQNSQKSPISTGFLAQDVLKIFPDMVSFTYDKKGQKLYGLNYDNFAVLAIKAIQEQQEVISNQQKKIDDLEKRMQAIENRMK